MYALLFQKIKKTLVLVVPHKNSLGFPCVLMKFFTNSALIEFCGSLVHVSK